jgi:hypothetical protein
MNGLSRFCARSPARGTFALAALLQLAACSAELQVPQEARVGCAEDVDCPAGMLCRGSPGRCLDAKVASTPAPSLAEPAAISPAVGTTGTRFVVAFQVDRPLAKAPAVHVDLGTHVAELTQEAAACDVAAGRYQYLYDVDGAEREGARAVTIDLEGESRNAALGLAGGSLLFDFTPPVLEGAAVLSAPRAGPSTPITLGFRASEALAGLPAVAMLAETPGQVGQPWQVESVDGARQFRATYTPLGPGHEIDGEYTVAVLATDIAGNTSRSLAAAQLTLDFTAPAPLSVDVRYTPDADNPLFGVSALRDGSEIVVSFQTDEPVADTPLVDLTCADGAVLPLGVVTASATFFVFHRLLAPADVVADGECLVHVTLRDDVGNAASTSVASPAVVVRRICPPALGPVELAKLRHLRVPWGAERTSGTAGQYLVNQALEAGAAPLSLTLDASSFELESAAIVQARIYADAERQSLLGVVNKGSAGWPPLRLLGADAERLWVTRIDSAGNESQAAPVSNVEWVATMGKKVGGSTLANPHTFERVAAFGRSVLQKDAVEAGANSGIGAVGFSAGEGGAIDRGVATVAPLLASASSPAVGYDHFAVFDRRRGVLVLVSSAGDVWEKKESWRHVLPADPELDGNPGFGGMALAFDEKRGVSVLVGYEVGAPAACGETRCTMVWEWNGQSWRHGGSFSEPQGRAHFGLVFDSKRGQIVLFGGKYGASWYDDLWAWGGSSWTKLFDSATGGRRPPLRWDFGMAYDRHRDRIVVFGGQAPGASPPYPIRGDTWEWDSKDWAPALAEDAPGAPASREGPGFAYDERRQRVVMFGGSRPEGGCGGDLPNDWMRCDETWEWDGLHWQQRQPVDSEGDGRAPSARSSPTLVYDAAGQNVLLFGGARAANPADAEWQWDGVSWRDLTPSATTPVASDEASAPNSAGVVFDGREAVLVDRAGEVWSYDGTRWHERCRAPACSTPPGNRVCTSLVYDARRDRVVRFFGADDFPDTMTHHGDVWEWDGAHWADVTPLTPGPDGDPHPRCGAAAAFDPASGKSVLFGGNAYDEDESLFYLDDLWSWDGAAWARLAPVAGPDGNPPAREYAHLLADPVNERLLLLGGAFGWSGYATGVWSYAGAAWSEIDGTALFGHGPAAYDPLRQGALVFAGPITEWTDASTIDVTPPNPLGDPRPGGDAYLGAFAAAYDPLFDATLLSIRGEQWWWRSAADAQPGHVMTVGLAAAMAEIPVAKAEVQEVQVTWLAAGAGEAMAERRLLRLAERSASGANLSTTYGLDDAAPIDDLGALVGRNPNAVWTLTVDDCCSGNSGTLNEWCILPEGGSAQCKTASLPLEDGGRVASEIDLRSLTLPALSGVQLSVDITHPDASELTLVLSVGPAAGSAVDGARLLVWQAGEWVEVDHNDASPSQSSLAGDAGNPWRLAWSTNEAATIAQLLLGAERQVAAAVTPVGKNGRGFAEVVSDYAEIAVRYRLP